MHETVPDPVFPLPTRPGVRKHDYTELIRLVIQYRAGWEIWIDDSGIWHARATTPPRCGASYQADCPARLECLVMGL